MSGGAYDYAYLTFRTVADMVHKNHLNSVPHQALAKLMRHLSDVMYEVEWADSDDKSQEDALAAIATIITKSQELQIATELAKAAQASLTETIKRYSTKTVRAKPIKIPRDPAKK